MVGERSGKKVSERGEGGRAGLSSEMEEQRVSFLFWGLHVGNGQVTGGPEWNLGGKRSWSSAVGQGMRPQRTEQAESLYLEDALGQG